APPAPSGNSETLKRAPKGGKLPYSEENLARLRGETPAAVQPAAPAAAPAPAAPAVALETATGIDWGWPANGRLLASFSGGRAGTENVNLGIDIDGNMGDPVLAAAPGRVIFVGAYPKHGNLAVLQHDDAYITVYAHLSRILVREGQTVRRGQRIADLGNSEADRPKLHFELRHKGKPLDPLRFLPPR
ncbi:MAG: M23 family metallopeptidase, partial [Sulfuritalea sp.]|nr:M23 family metallopeptidase [Sulfuritalea sp.]